MSVHVYRNRQDDDRTRDQLHFCRACNGWYGVPHIGNHCKLGKTAARSMNSCACAPCRRASHKPIEGAFGFFTDAEWWQP